VKIQIMQLAVPFHPQSCNGSETNKAVYGNSLQML